jgi:hypothetical protein
MTLHSTRFNTGPNPCGIIDFFENPEAIQRASAAYLPPVRERRLAAAGRRAASLRERMAVGFLKSGEHGRFD